jgi:uncharacterized membrane protein YgdD (TMEM256/DUF423 family)
MMRLTTRLSAVSACLLGAFGCGLAAAASHIMPGKSMEAAATIAMVTAPSVLALLMMTRTGLARPFLGQLAALLAWLGAWMFSGTIALRALASTSDWAVVHMLATIPMAAPAGGTLLIVAWIMGALAALIK